MTDEKPPANQVSFEASLFDAYSPAEMAHRVERVGIAKAKQETVPLLVLAVLAGAFIALGAMFFTVVSTQTGMGLGPSRFLGGLAFSLGLILVIVGGAELFTGNALIIMGWAHRKVTTKAVLRNWGLVYVGNLVGALGMALMAHWSGFLHMGGDAAAVTAVAIAAAKVALPFDVAFIRGVLCNVLVCLAVWLCFSARSVTARILAILFPITAFVALGFEHSIANMYFIPMGMLVAADPAYDLARAGADIGVGGFVANLVPVTLGNIVGGGVFVALTYYLVYLRGRD